MYLLYISGLTVTLVEDQLNTEEFRIPDTIQLVIFEGLIFCGLGCLDDFIDLYFRGIYTPTLITYSYIAKLQ